VTIEKRSGNVLAFPIRETDLLKQDGMRLYRSFMSITDQHSRLRVILFAEELASQERD
jgi:hypothetical protein